MPVPPWLVQAAPWVLDALQLWLTSDQEVEITELQRQMQRAYQAQQPGQGAAPGAPASHPIGSGAWLEDLEWIETEWAALPPACRRGVRQWRL